MLVISSLSSWQLHCLVRLGFTTSDYLVLLVLLVLVLCIIPGDACVPKLNAREKGPGWLNELGSWIT
jgi:hypothetical protein